jgi:hypothetical protein
MTWLGRIAAGFIAGFVSVLFFHQGALILLNALGVTHGTPFPMRPTPPFGVPQILSLAFWGGVWGIVFIAIAAPLRRFRLLFIVTGAIFGAVLPTIVGRLVVAPLKGLPVGSWQLSAMTPGLLLNGAFGLGIAVLFLALAGWLVPAAALPETGRS